MGMFHAVRLGNALARSPSRSINFACKMQLPPVNDTSAVFIGTSPLRRAISTTAINGSESFQMVLANMANMANMAKIVEKSNDIAIKAKDETIQAKNEIIRRSDIANAEIHKHMTEKLRHLNTDLLREQGKLHLRYVALSLSSLANSVRCRCIIEGAEKLMRIALSTDAQSGLKQEEHKKLNNRYDVLKAFLRLGLRKPNCDAGDFHKVSQRQSV